MFFIIFDIFVVVSALAVLPDGKAPVCSFATQKVFFRNRSNLFFNYNTDKNELFLQPHLDLV
jgi:hypothetical protein